MPHHASPADLLWIHQLRREHSFLLDRVKALAEAPSVATEVTAFTFEALQTRLDALVDSLKKSEQDDIAEKRHLESRLAVLVDLDRKQRSHEHRLAVQERLPLELKALKERALSLENARRNETSEFTRVSLRLQQLEGSAKGLEAKTKFIDNALTDLNMAREEIDDWRETVVKSVTVMEASVGKNRESLHHLSRLFPELQRTVQSYERRHLDLEKRNLELDNRNIQLNKKLLESERRTLELDKRLKILERSSTVISSPHEAERLVVKLKLPSLLPSLPVPVPGVLDIARPMVKNHDLQPTPSPLAPAQRAPPRPQLKRTSSQATTIADEEDELTPLTPHAKKPRIQAAKAVQVTKAVQPTKTFQAIKPPVVVPRPLKPEFSPRKTRGPRSTRTVQISSDRTLRSQTKATLQQTGLLKQASQSSKQELLVKRIPPTRQTVAAKNAIR